MARKKPLPILENVLVESYAAEGKSLARVDGKVIFIEHAVPGDVVDLRLTKNKKDWAEGFPLQYRSYSADRTEPFCSHFGTWVVANGKCCPTKNNCNTNTSKWWMY